MHPTHVADRIHVRLQLVGLVRSVCSLVMTLLELLLVVLEVLLGQLSQRRGVPVMVDRLDLVMQLWLSNVLSLWNGIFGEPCLRTDGPGLAWSFLVNSFLDRVAHRRSRELPP